MDSKRYPGIDPHLNSHLQHVAGWKGFHAKHIAHLGELLDQILPEGYYTADEESLQIGIYDRESGERLASSPSVPDLLIFRRDSNSEPGEFAAGASPSPTLTMPLIERAEEEMYIGSLVIYRLQAGGLPGRPVTRIEVLSPANKAPGSHHDQYMAKRLDALRSGLCLIEVDYLHERRPIDRRIPSYADGEAEAPPYAILVSDPRPSLVAGTMRVFGFGVLDALPRVPVPLEGDTIVELDFNVAYRETINGSRLFRDLLADPSREPANFGAYHEGDRAQIRAFMRTLTA
jgi:hypothetical protein